MLKSMQSRQFRSRLPAFLACATLAALAACADMANSPTGPEARKSPKTTPPPDTATTPATPTPAGGAFYAGAYLGDAASTPQNIAAAIRGFGTMTGKQPSLVKTFHSLNCDFTATGWCGQVLRAAASTGATNYVALDLKWTGAPATGLLDAIIAGQADARLTAVARGVKSVGSLVLLEPGWEMNGNWDFAWQGVLNGGNANAPVKFAAAWRHMVDIFRREGADNVRWVFNPNVGNSVTHTASGASSWNWYANYYPGDAYVDYVGAHGFNGPAVWNTSWQDFATMTDGTAADHMLSDLAARYPTKPIIIGEFATQEGSAGQKAAWITDAYRRMRANPRVVGAVWFNANKEADWRVESSTASLQAFQAAMADSGIQTAFVPVAPSRTMLASN
ncbi:glycoside hydrolase family 26 protein [Longimicrobium sp.]|uniref:glycoside hydrolase family 26 protein n=1 Tax=Longimicrobium sp. TaxID=2029185 RepID=UPI002C157CCF|nr:glycosyl hydrolase [Longimicrobium sp.]HSU14713.1 glycosyl hydrolase [Longimicrobium sp.]